MQRVTFLALLSSGRLLPLPIIYIIEAQALEGLFWRVCAITCRCLNTVYAHQTLSSA